MTIQPLQDSIQLKLSADKTIVNETVKLIANVTAQVSAEEAPETLPARVREIMNKIVDTTKYEQATWHFSNMVRTKDDTGFERVTLLASARVPEAENYNLVSRAEKVSRPGLVINNISADTSIPSYMIEEAISELRVRIAKKAVKEAEALSEALGRTYRIHSLSYGSGLEGGPKSLSPSNMLAATAYGSGMGDDDTLGNAQKITLTANVALMTVVDLPPSYQGLVAYPKEVLDVLRLAGL